ncbi:MAG: hypothetical protein V7701_16020, partial [Sneathiella sp.]
MVDEAEDSELDEDLDEEDGESGQKKKKKLSGKVLVLFILLPILVIGGGAGGAYFAGLFDSPGPTEEEIAAEAAEKNKQVVFYDLPEMLVNLNTGTA